ncbi:MAG: antibiotic biosynthesis monooxygenase family protein [Catenulispora sp.]
MYTVINRIPVPASEPGRFEEHFSASTGAALSGVDQLLGARLLRPTKDGGDYPAAMEFTLDEAFAAAPASETPDMSSVTESDKTVPNVRADGRDA